MGNREVGSSGRNPLVSVRVCVYKRMCVYKWSSVKELSVSIYDPLTCDRLQTFPLSQRVNIWRRGEQEGHLEVIHTGYTMW